MVAPANELLTPKCDHARGDRAVCEASPSLILASSFTHAVPFPSPGCVPVQVDVEADLDKVMALFKCVHGKDVFEAFYKKGGSLVYGTLWLFVCACSRMPLSWLSTVFHGATCCTFNIFPASYRAPSNVRHRIPHSRSPQTSRSGCFWVDPRRWMWKRAWCRG